MFNDGLSSIKYGMSNQTRDEQVKGYLFRILNTQGRIYTLGLLMGILVRLSRTDYNLYQELKRRSEAVNK
jgi:hypothetical protein